MPFTFPDPSIQSEVTAPNGEVWRYVDGAWTVVSAINDDQNAIQELTVRVTDIEEVNREQDEEIEQNEELLEPVNSALVNLSSRLDEVETLDLQSAVSALAIARQDIIDLKAKVNTLELTSFLILE